MDLGLNLWMNVAHDLRMWEFKRDSRLKGEQYATAMNMLLDTNTPWLGPCYSEKTVKEKSNFLFSKACGLVAHDRCLNYHYVQGSDVFRKLSIKSEISLALMKRLL